MNLCTLRCLRAPPTRGGCASGTCGEAQPLVDMRHAATPSSILLNSRTIKELIQKSMDTHVDVDVKEDANVDLDADAAVHVITTFKDPDVHHECGPAVLNIDGSC